MLSPAKQMIPKTNPTEEFHGIVRANSRSIRMYALQDEWKIAIYTHINFVFILLFKKF